MQEADDSESDSDTENGNTAHQGASKRTQDPPTSRSPTQDPELLIEDDGDVTRTPLDTQGVGSSNSGTGKKGRYAR
ncbi:hypothetical protein VKT23_009869 [Stygiomarasmius scandens]|uniref:Uncharacterized protein n=1 Tax=Marasmiellus scandens TaxID=2682957 RepID=A0ABR1JDI1_9AGAR